MEKNRRETIRQERVRGRVLMVTAASILSVLPSMPIQTQAADPSRSEIRNRGSRLFGSKRFYTWHLRTCYQPNKGDVVGGDYSIYTIQYPPGATGSAPTAFLYERSHMHDLGVPYAFGCTASRINDKGIIVGG